MWPWCPRAAFVEHPHPSGTCPLQRQARAQGCPDLCPPPPGSLGAAGQTAVLTGVQAEGLAGRVPLWICGESRASQHTAQQSPGTPRLQSWDKGSEACASGTQLETAQAEAGCCPSESQQGRSCQWPHRDTCPRQAKETWATLGASLQNPGGEECRIGSHPEAPAQRGHGRQRKWALDLRVLVKRFLISAMVAWGSTWGKHRPQTS